MDTVAEDTGDASVDSSIVMHQKDTPFPILVVTSTSCEQAFTFLQSSLDYLQHPQERRHVVHLSELDPPAGYCTGSWAISTLPGYGERWVREVVSYVASHQGQRFICAGPGVQFLSAFIKVQNRWNKYMIESNLDLLFVTDRHGSSWEQRRGEVTGLFFLAECNPRTLEFWQAVLQRQLSEPVMVGNAPRGAQFHMNNLLTYRVGNGPQDGDFDIKWDLLADMDCIWGYPHNEAGLGTAAIHLASGPNRVAMLKRVSEQAGIDVSGRNACETNAANISGAEADMFEEMDRITLEIARLRAELICAAPHELERSRPSLELAAAELLEEVHKFAGDFGIVAANGGIVFESVD